MQDITYALRSLRRTPGFTAAALLTLAIGIGATTTVFALLDPLILRSLPVPEAERLYRVFTVRANGSVNSQVSFPNFLDLRRTSNLGSLAAHSLTPLSLGGIDGVGGSERVWGALVSGNYFSTLGVQPILGRTFLPEEDTVPGEHPVVIVSDRLWRTKLAANSQIIGQSLRLNGHAFTIVGVASPNMPQPEPLFATDLWMPLAMQSQAMPGAPWKLTSRTDTWLRVIGRLPPDASLESVQAPLRVLAARIQRDHADEISSLSLIARPERDGRSLTLPGVAPFGFGALAVMAIVLVVACANIAGLLLARGLARRAEFAVRASLGASRIRLVRQVVTESAVLSIVGGTIGLGLTAIGTRGLLALTPPLPLEVSLDAQVDVRVLMFTLLLSLVTTVLAGLLPALQSSGAALTFGTRQPGGTVPAYHLRKREALVVAQVMVSLVLLILTGLFVRSLQQAERVDVGFAPANRLLGSVDVGRAGYSEARGARFQLRVLDEIASRPGVVAASFTTHAPLGPGYLGDARVYLDGDAPGRVDERPLAYYDNVGPDYFRVMGTTLLSGRDFTRDDRPGAPPVAIVNQTFARSLWPNLNPLGQRFRLNAADGPSLEVIGVVADGKYQTLGEAPQRHVFLSALQRYVPTATLVIHTAGNPAAYAPTLRDAVQKLDPDLPVTDVGSMTEHLGFALYPARASAILLVFCGSFGLLLASAGLYGVVAYMVRQRTREVAIRTALGATPRDVLRLLTFPAAWIVGCGIGLGLTAALGVTRVVSGVLYGTSPLDAVTFASAPALLLIVALVATVLPARRAASVNPVDALRAE